MTELERRLRAAMHAAADQPPADLMAQIRRRHRRHVRRLLAGCAAAMLAIGLAAAPIARGLQATAGPAGPAATSPAASHPGPAATRHCSDYCGPPGSTVRAAPGTILRDCASNNYSTLPGSRWRSRSLRVGPLWLVWAREPGYWPPSRPVGHGEVAAVGVPVIVAAGATVIVRVAPAARSRFRFLNGFNGSDRYSLRAGSDGITFAACPRWYAGPATVYWVGYLDDGISCVPLQVWETPASRPVRVNLSTRGGTCR